MEVNPCPTVFTAPKTHVPFSSVDTLVIVNETIEELNTSVNLASELSETGVLLKTQVL